MVKMRVAADIDEKLRVLSQDSRYDLACACGMSDADRRRRSKDNKWIYPVVLPDGRRTFLFKTLLSNFCVNDCKYCPLRSELDPRRYTLQPEELANTFLSYYRSKMVSGLFLSSGVVGSSDNTMEKINRVAKILRKKDFRGFIHLKIIPGASPASIKESVSLASAVSLNIETAGEENFKRLSTTKNYLKDVIEPIKQISSLTQKGMRYSRVKQTTQFVVGASKETDQDIVKYTWGMYKRLGLSRVYFSAYQQNVGESRITGDISQGDSGDILTREHRLYQADWLMRKYGFKAEEIPFECDGSLSLKMDPKEAWARHNPEFFPVNVNKADKFELLRVPGFGHVAVNSILQYRKSRGKLTSITALGKSSKRFRKAENYIKF